MIGELAAIAGAIVWSSTNIMFRSASDRMGIIPLNALRSSAGALFVLATLVAVGKVGELGQTPILTVVYLVFAVVLAIGIGDTLFFRSMTLIGVSRASPISNIYPLFTLPIALAFLGESLSWLNVTGTLLIVAGVYIIGRSAKPMDGLDTGRREKFRHEGLLLALAAAVCWSISTSILKLALLDTDVFVANSIRVPAAALILTALAARNRRGLQVLNLGWRQVAFVALAGILSIGVGGLLYLVAVQEAGAAKTAALTAINPVITAPLSALFLKEKVSPTLIAGIAISIIGVWLVV